MPTKFNPHQFNAMLDRMRHLNRDTDVDYLVKVNHLRVVGKFFDLPTDGVRDLAKLAPNWIPDKGHERLLRLIMDHGALSDGSYPLPDHTVVLDCQPIRSRTEASRAGQEFGNCLGNVNHQRSYVLMIHSGWLGIYRLGSSSSDPLLMSLYRSPFGWYLGEIERPGRLKLTATQRASCRTAARLICANTRFLNAGTKQSLTSLGVWQLWEPKQQ